MDLNKLDSKTRKALSKFNDNNGKLLEKWVRRALLVWKSSAKDLFTHRFTDTAAAGRLVESQPSDFLVQLPGCPILLECKSTVIGKQLEDIIKSRSKTSLSQQRKQKDWIKAKGFVLYVWADVRTKECSIYQYRNQPRKLKLLAKVEGDPSQPDVLIDAFKKAICKLKQEKM